MLGRVLFLVILFNYTRLTLAVTSTAEKRSHPSANSTLLLLTVFGQKSVCEPFRTAGAELLR